MDYSLVDRLLNDVRLECGRLSASDGRRAAIRAVFAAVEGTLWQLKQRLLAVCQDRLDRSEIALLREERYSTDRDGNPQTKAHFLSLRENIRFTVKVVSKVQQTYHIDFGGVGWSSLMDSLDVRHRITHPKLLSDLEVTDEEAARAIQGMAWFCGLTLEALGSVEPFGGDPYGQSRENARLLREFYDLPDVFKVKKT